MVRRGRPRFQAAAASTDKKDPRARPDANRARVCGTLNRADVQSVTLGTFIGNLGIEGISYDPLTGYFLCFLINYIADLGLKAVLCPMSFIDYYNDI